MATEPTHPFGGPMTMHSASDDNSGDIFEEIEETLQNLIGTIHDRMNPRRTRTRGSGEQQLIANALCDDVASLVKRELQQQQRDNAAIHPQHLLDLPRELLDKIIINVSQTDLKSLRVTCSKLEDAANPVVFDHICLSKTKKDRRHFFSVATTPHLAMHVKQLTWFEMAEDETVFGETAVEVLREIIPGINYNDPILLHLAQAGGQLEHDIKKTLPVLADMASSLFWLPSTPQWNNLERARINVRRDRIIHSWTKLFHRALDSMPKLTTFASRPMPAYHVLSEQDSAYEFVAYTFQKETLSNIKGYQRNDGLFSFLLPAMKRPQCAVRHLYWADEVAGKLSSSANRIRPEHRTAFRNLTSIDLCLSLRPTPPPGLIQYGHPFSAELTWFRLGKCLDLAHYLTEITICFEKAISDALRPKALLEALDSLLFRPNGHWPNLTSLTLRDGLSEPSDLLEGPLSVFLKRHSQTLRHLTFQRWYVSQIFLRFCGNKRLPQMERIQIDNGDIDEDGASAAEPALLALLRGETDKMPLEDGATSCNVTIPAVEEPIEEKHHVSCWANPKFATVTKEMDFCAGVLQRTTMPSDDEDDEDFEDADWTDTSDSVTDYELDVDSDAEFNHQSESGDGSGDVE
ncbi:hypothetical protein Daus18300_013170 [Diaporthe australafricana]|uniref:F-box domain-containing protein n=1 Tax=Diaporthe australafricana TaxID=127596 RepID=A0ABR3W009_9PEZI